MIKEIPIAVWSEFGRQSVAMALKLCEMIVIPALDFTPAP
jgi:hypothetical protein